MIDYLPYLPPVVALVLGWCAGKLYAAGVRRGVDLALENLTNTEMRFDILMTNDRGTIETTLVKKAGKNERDNKRGRAATATN